MGGIVLVTTHFQGGLHVRSGRNGCNGHRLDILNTLFLSAYLYQSIIEVLRLFAKFHE